MTLSCFDATEATQFAVRLDTGLHPDGLSLGIFIGSENCTMEKVEKYRKAGIPVPPDFNAYDAMDWDTAVNLARWILDCDERFNVQKEEKEGMTDRCCKTCGYAVVKDLDDKPVVPFCTLYRCFMPEDDVCHHYEEGE